MDEKGRKVRKEFLVLLALLVCSSAIAEETRVQYIPTREYFETTLREVNQAQKSIKVYMFVIAAHADESGSKVMRLLDALVGAKGRGAVYNLF